MFYLFDNEFVGALCRLYSSLDSCRLYLWQLM